MNPGTTWEERQEVCQRIADQHQWQTDHAPDARVLILLGLAGPHADPAVAQMKGGRLDQGQRAEAARQSQTVAHSLRPPATAAVSRTENPGGHTANLTDATASRSSAAASQQASAKTPARRENRKIWRKVIKKSRPKPAQA